MVKLSALKGIRGQYRLRVRYRLLVLEYATLHGPTAAARRYGVCPRTVCRWRRRWRAEGLAGLTPRYPRQRPSRLRPEVLGHIHHARDVARRGRPDAAVASAGASGPARHGHDPTRLSGAGPALSASYAETRAAAAETVREGGARRVGAGGCEVRQDRGALGVPVHGPGRLHPLPRAPSLPPPASRLEPGLPGRAPTGLSLSDSASAVRLRSRRRTASP